MGISRLAIVCVLGLVAVSASASAADLNRDYGGSLKDEPAYAPAFSWTGFYLGGNAGYAWSDGNNANIEVLNEDGNQYPSGPLPYALTPEGGFAGIQIGYNHQRGGIVFGIEADLQGADIGDKSKTSFPNPPNIGDFDYYAATDVEWFGTLRGRLGYSFDRTLVYVTGGLAFGSVKYDADYIFTGIKCCAGSFGEASGSDTATGFVVGGGIEHALGANWSVKVEYQYIDLGTLEVDGALFNAGGVATGETIKSEIDTDFHTVRVGLNYHFGAHEEALK